jgi:hypothetical protein
MTDENCYDREFMENGLDAARTGSDLLPPGTAFRIGPIRVMQPRRSKTDPDRLLFFEEQAVVHALAF